MPRVYSIFRSLQGESSRVGSPCAFVRLAGCPLSCVYCDTREARESPGEEVSVDGILARVARLGTGLVEVTGGEPLAQQDAPALLEALADAGYEVLLETSGAFPIAGLDRRVRVIMDVKTPGSGMEERFCRENLDALEKGRHEVKLVVTGRDDFDWAADLVREERLFDRAEVFVSPAAGLVSPREAADWILGSGLPLRLGLQLHRVIWPEGEVER
jgi:7-carboxy-7-deazaguanine synthase